jgi:hypothetical protein
MRKIEGESQSQSNQVKVLAYGIWEQKPRTRKSTRTRRIEREGKPYQGSSRLIKATDVKR